MKNSSIKISYFTLPLLLLAFLFNACSDDEEDFEETKLSMEKPRVSEVSVSTVDTALSFEAEVTGDGGGIVLRRGFVWHTHRDYDIQFNTGSSSNGRGLGAFKTTTGDFKVGVEYHIKAYAENQVGIAYGPSRTVVRRR